MPSSPIHPSTTRILAGARSVRLSHCSARNVHERAHATKSERPQNQPRGVGHQTVWRRTSLDLTFASKSPMVAPSMRISWLDPDGDRGFRADPTRDQSIAARPGLPLESRDPAFWDGKSEDRLRL